MQKESKLLSYISFYRTQIMGIAVLWIMLYHTKNDYGINFINRLETIGYGGVDIFFFISGFGLYYSMKKNSISQFYKNRFWRIIPEYMFALLIFNIVNGFSITRYLLDISTIGFWVPTMKIHYCLWYIPAIIFLYVIFPLLYKLMQSRIGCIMCILTTMIICSIVAYNYILGNYSQWFIPYNNLLLFIYRLPIFVVGILAGKVTFTNDSLSSKTYIIFIICMIIGLAFLFIAIHKYIFINFTILKNAGLFYVPFILIVPGLCLSLSYILRYIPKHVSNIFVFPGKRSLELYLVHEFIFKYNEALKSLLSCSSSMSYFILILLSLISAQILFYLNRKMMHLFRK